MKIVQRICIRTPFATHQFQRSKTQNNRFLELGKEHTHETYRFKVFDITDRRSATYRNLKLIPGYLFRAAITQSYFRYPFIRNVILPDFQFGRSQVNSILKISFRLRKGIILIDIFNIRTIFGSSRVTFRRIFLGNRVALRIIKILVTFKNAFLFGIIVRSAIVMKFITGR